jgi:hypothetical protein
MFLQRSSKAMSASIRVVQKPSTFAVGPATAKPDLPSARRDLPAKAPDIGRLLSPQTTRASVDPGWGSFQSSMAPRVAAPTVAAGTPVISAAAVPNIGRLIPPNMQASADPGWTTYAPVLGLPAVQPAPAQTDARGPIPDIGERIPAAMPTSAGIAIPDIGELIPDDVSYPSASTVMADIGYQGATQSSPAVPDWLSRREQQGRPVAAMFLPMLSESGTQAAAGVDAGRQFVDELRGRMALLAGLDAMAPDSAQAQANATAPFLDPGLTAMGPGASAQPLSPEQGVVVVGELPMSSQAVAEQAYLYLPTLAQLGGPQFPSAFQPDFFDVSYFVPRQPLPLFGSPSAPQDAAPAQAQPASNAVPVPDAAIPQFSGGDGEVPPAPPAPQGPPPAQQRYMQSEGPGVIPLAPAGAWNA